MAENLNSYGGVVGGVAVTAVNSITPTIGTYVPAPDPGSVGQVKMTPENAVFLNSSNALVGGGEVPGITSNVDSSSYNPEGVDPQVDGISVTTVQSSSVASVDGANTGPPPSGMLPVATGVKKTSFQITSVTVDSSASNDGGDDSADDLDESHTEDSSDVATADVSRHTSESRAPGGTSQQNDDNFTRNDIFYNPAPPSSMNIAPVIPTSSQYGLAIVPEGLNPVTEAPPPAPVIMNDPATDKSDPDKDIVHNRFKVVKIVSTEPFKKGRWMCMDYFDHTTTTSGTSTASKEGAPSQPSQQGVPQSQAHGSMQPQMQAPVDKPTSVNVANLQGSNVPMTSSPPQPSNILPDTQQTVVQQQPPQHAIQTQMQPSMHEQDGSLNQSGLPNGNGQHYHVNHTLPHNVQGVAMNHVAQSATVVNNNVADPSAYNNTISNHNTNMPPSGNSYQSSMSQQQQQQQQQQQYYNNTGVMQDFHGGMPSQQQQSIASQQQTMTSQQSARPLTSQVPIVQNQAPTQTLGQIGQQPSISQNTPVPLLNQTISSSQIHQTPVQVSQPSHLPAQSLPHGAHAQMTGTGSISNTPANVSPAPQQAAQSLGHNMLQQNKPAFMNQQQHQQSQAPTQPQFQQQQPSQQQQMMQGSQQCIDGQQNVYPQAPQVNQIAQNTSNQQQQPQNYQPGVMMQNIPSMQQQQVHVQQMNASGVNQHQVQMQQNQPGTQQQGMYPPPGQMMGHQMPISSQGMNIQQAPQQLIQQQIPNQQMMQQQPQMVGQQQHHQQMMGMSQQQQPMVSQTQPNAQQQQIMTQQQMMPQMLQQNTQMSGVVQQTPMVSQPGMMTQQQQGMIPSQSNIQQPNIIQQMPQQQSYPTQAQPQTINSQQPMQQPLMQQYPQQQANPVAQQQQLMQPQNQSNIMAPQMGQSMTAGQQISAPQQNQQSQPQSAPQQQQQQQPPQVSMPSQQSQQNVFQNSNQQMQVSQANMVQNMTNLQQVHPIMPPSSQSIPQLQTSTGIPVQSNEASNVPPSIANQDTSSQQQQQPHSVVQQVQPTMPVCNLTQIQSNQPAVPSPAEIHQTSQPQAVPVVPPSVSVNTVPTPSPAITTASLSAAATVIIDGVNSLADTSTAGSTGTEEGDSATGTNTVAIDNKIEQAMDLVKSHLMFAVREEVEVLKEKISELMERISQLEYENSILRANATQETLAQLQKSTPAPNVNEGHQGFS